MEGKNIILISLRNRGNANKTRLSHRPLETLMCDLSLAFKTKANSINCFYKNYFPALWPLEKQGYTFYEIFSLIILKIYFLIQKYKMPSTYQHYTAYKILFCAFSYGAVWVFQLYLLQIWTNSENTFLFREKKTPNVQNF